MNRLGRITCWLALGVVLLGTGAGRAEEATTFVAKDYARQTIYHSPQTPGYTCWVGAWVMPDKSLIVTFKQAMGPLKDRPRSRDLMKKMGLNPDDPRRDFTGLTLANVYLRSADGGTTWAK